MVRMKIWLRDLKMKRRVQAGDWPEISRKVQELYGVRDPDILSSKIQTSITFYVRGESGANQVWMKNQALGDIFQEFQRFVAMRMADDRKLEALQREDLETRAKRDPKTFQELSKIGYVDDD